MGNDKLGYIRQFIIEHTKVLGIIDIPKETFMPHTSTKTSVLLLQKYKDEEDKKQDYPIFMSICEKCGHDRHGNSIDEDDLAKVASEFKKWRKENNIEF